MITTTNFYKFLIIAVLFGIFFVLLNILSEQKTMPIEKDKTETSTLIPVDGLFVYTDSKPTQDYEILGVLDITFSLAVQYSDIRNKFIEKCLEDYPTADGLILTLNSGSTDTATVIKFKDAR